MKRLLLCVSTVSICLLMSQNAQAHHHGGFGHYMERSLAWQLPMMALGGGYGGWGYNRFYSYPYYNSIPVYNNYNYNYYTPPPPPPPPIYPVYRNYNYNYNYNPNSGYSTWIPR